MSNIPKYLSSTFWKTQKGAELNVKFLLAHLNINSLNTNLDCLQTWPLEMISHVIWDNLRFLDIPFRVDCDRNEGGIMASVRTDILVSYLSTEDKPTEVFSFYVNLLKKKCLMICFFNPHRNKMARHLEALGPSLDLYSEDHENINLLGYFNVNMDGICLGYFWNL